MKSEELKDYKHYINSVSGKNRWPEVDIIVFYDFLKSLNTDNTGDNAPDASDFPEVEVSVENTWTIQLLLIKYSELYEN